MSKKTVKKRNGDVVDFDVKKIIAAISKANDSSNEMADLDIDLVAHAVDVKTDDTSCVDIEIIQDLVERTLQEYGSYETAKEYILYREKRHQQREASYDLMQGYSDLLFADAGDMDLKRDNANINGNAPMGIMLKLGTEGAKSWALNYALPEKYAQPHKEHVYHLHDLDFSFITLNCLQNDLGKILKNGFNTGHGFLREPNSIRSAASLACIVIQSTQNDCFGGQSINALDFALAPYVKKSFKKALWTKFNDWLYYSGINTNEIDKKYFDKMDFDLLHYTEDRNCIINSLSITDEQGADNVTITAGNYIDYYLETGESAGDKIYSLACDAVEEETKQAMEALVHNFNSLHSRAGSQVPFSSINFGMDTTPEGRLISDKLLDAVYAGLGHGETPIFPITVFTMKDGINYNPGDPNYDLFHKACKVSAKRLFPNFCNIDAPYNLQYYKGPREYNSFVATMGCRTRVMGNINGPSESGSRGNFSFVTLNLPMIALMAKEKTDFNENLMETFYKLYDKYILLAKEYLEYRYNIIAHKKVKNFPFIMGQGIWMGSENLTPEDEIGEVLKHASISIGFVGLAECLVALTGYHQGESEIAQELGLEIVSHMRKMTDQFTEDTHMNWSTFATPAENYCGVALRAVRKRFGIIEGVTDKEYFTNSFHVEVGYHVNAFKKIQIEAPYHALCNAGAISYIELDGDPLKNVKAFERLVRAMHDADMTYMAINHPVDRDPICGYTGIINNECPCCHRKENEEIHKFTIKRLNN